jgi:23S rRNA pseudouridine2605 synthase
MTERVHAPGIRLQKVLARAGVASRRAAEDLIRAGRVRVDGRIARELGVRVDPKHARVEVDGKRIVAEPLVYLVLNKPRGVVCTLSDPEGRPTVAELLRGAGARVLPVGRLDFNTGGALLCTNDGEFANRLAHPRHHAPKEYLVKVGGRVDERALRDFRSSISIDGRSTRPAEVSVVRVEGDKTWLAVRLEEGRNRQVRRLAEHAGLTVMRLVRTSHAGITVDGVPPGRFRHLDVDELMRLRDEYGVPRRIHRAVLARNEAHGGAESVPRPRRRVGLNRPDRNRGVRERTTRNTRRSDEFMPAPPPARPPRPKSRGLGGSDDRKVTRRRTSYRDR